MGYDFFVKVFQGVKSEYSPQRAQGKSQEKKAKPIAETQKEPEKRQGIIQKASTTAERHLT